MGKIWKLFWREIFLEIFLIKILIENWGFAEDDIVENIGLLMVFGESICGVD